MTDLEIKQRKWQLIGLTVGALAVIIALGPLYLTILHGIGAFAALVATVFIGITVWNFVPWFSVKLANWRLKALKAEAAKNPIETLENRYLQLKENLLKQRDNIKARVAIAKKIFSQITDFEQKFNKTSPRRDAYQKLNQLIDLAKGRYKKAALALVNFGQVIEEKRADWEIVLSMNEANKLAQAGEDFTSKLMQDTALNTIQQGLDLAFAELDAAVMDENIEKLLNGQDVEIVVSATSSTPNQVESASPVLAIAAPNELDFDAEIEIIPEKVSVRK